MVSAANTASGLIEAISIFAKYDEPDSYFAISAEHDEIWLGPDPEIVTPEDTARLEQLGFEPDFDGNSCFHRFV